MKKMEYPKSHIEQMLGVIRNLLDDIADQIESCETLRETIPWNLRTEMDRDFQYIASRVRHEGIEFLTISLPRLGKWYDRRFFSGVEESILGFKPYYFHSKNKGLLVEFSCPTFCRLYGAIHAITVHCERVPYPEVALIMRAYRSLFYLFYKLEVPLGRRQKDEALLKWLSNEFELSNFDYPDFFDSDLMAAREILARLLGQCHDVFDLRRMRCAHGPGAVAGGEIDVDKWKSFDVIDTLQQVYPRYDILGWASRCRMSSLKAELVASFCKDSTTKPAVSRLLFVPKDSRGPRTISCEPKELMFVQQGIARNLMVRLFERSGGRINFVDQKVNSSLALASSLSGEFATVDLQDASDRVSWRLVTLLFPDGLHRYLRATRSHSTQLPDGMIYPDHAKYAPMGSALCFPIESAIFWTLAVVAGINSGLSQAEAEADTYVYGDDIIIRPQAYPFLVALLSRVGLKVNDEKSYVYGPFRESCGIDAWKGYNVTPFKIKKDVFRRSLDAALATAVCEYSSSCFALNYRKTGDYLYNLVNSTYRGVIRHYFGDLGCLHVVDPLAFDGINAANSHWDPMECCLRVTGWVVQLPTRPNHLEALGRLNRALLGNWLEHDPTKVAVPRAAKIRKRRTRVGRG